MPTRRQQFGTAAEDRAAHFLLAKGWQLLDRHVTSRYGEIDLLMLDGETIVAVEVKARASQKFGRAIESVTPEKITRIVSALHEVMMSRHWEARSYRIDVVTIEKNLIQHIESIG